MGIKKENLKGLLLTWDEVHMIISGLGDGLALRKNEDIPEFNDVITAHDPRDFYAILAKEAWYYKAGYGIGKIAWVPVVAIAIILIIWKVGLIL